MCFSGFVFLQISSISISSPTSDCLALVETCMSDLCRHEQTVLTGSCEVNSFSQVDQLIKKMKRDLNVTTACMHDGSGSCVDRFAACVSDLICNRHLTPVLRACTVELCDNDRCQREIQQLYGNMPQKTAEMLVMCECEGSDPNCLLMKTGLQSGTCGVETLVCQERLDQCVQDRTCRYVLYDRNLQVDECFTLMNPAHILGADSECKKAFLNTLGTVLHQPCTCKGVHDDYLLMCTRIHDVFHNRRHFNNLLYVLAALLLAGILILLLLVVVSKIW
uniref:GDNF/GAS1 domain-containing protein n=1 Tax=Kryptolebias marmoratus TaxID=37003 RepID=A0A3Q3BAI5_KRYMA